MSQLIASIAASDEWQVFLDNLPNLPFATWESFYATALTTILGLALGLPVGRIVDAALGTKIILIVVVMLAALAASDETHGLPLLFSSGV